MPDIGKDYAVSVRQKKDTLWSYYTGSTIVYGIWTTTESWIQKLNRRILIKNVLTNKWDVMMCYCYHLNSSAFENLMESIDLLSRSEILLWLWLSLWP